MIRIAICDDDEIYLTKTVKPMLIKAQKTVGIQLDIRLFTSGKRLLEEYENNIFFDIVILDIDMPEIGGKQLAKKLRLLDNNLFIAFLSAYKEEVYDVIPLNISAFIPKDYDKEKCLNKIVELIQKYINEKPEQKMFCVLKDGKTSVIRLNTDNILYIKLERSIVVIYTENGELISAERSLRQLEAELFPPMFLKINRNIIVNVDKVYEILDTEVVLKNGTHLPVSRRQRKELLSSLLRIISAKVVK